MNRKMCSSCKRTLDTSQFYKSKLTGDKLTTCCKQCLRDMSLTYYYKNSERCNKSTVEWRRKNKDKHYTNVRRYRKNNPDKVREFERKKAERNRKKWENGELKLPEEATCITCCITKTIDEFYKRTSTTKGYDATCKECVRKRVREKYHSRKIEKLEDWGFRKQGEVHHKLMKAGL